MLANTSRDLFFAFHIGDYANGIVATYADDHDRKHSFATYAEAIEAEAVAYARERIAFARSGKLKLFGVEPGAWLEPGESQRACRLMMRDLVLCDAITLMDAVAFARAGFELWEDCLRELVLEFQNRDEKMPVYLAAFAMDLARYPRKAGRRRADDMMRDLIVGHVVGMVAERFNLKPRRNPASKRPAPAACSIVAAALALEGMAMSEDNVVKLWQAMPAYCKSSKWSQWLDA
jgi:hypothetical protein